ncbi:Filament-forming protein [Coemansia sp. RSA 1358]|nr:Filament-forming protein [Coemansia sp. RSA 1358]
MSVVLEKLGDYSSNPEIQEFLTCIQQKLEQSINYLNTDDTLKEKAQLQYENTRLESEVHRLNKSIGQTKSKLDGAKAEAVACANELREVKAKIDELQSELQSERSHKNNLTTQGAQQRDQLSTLRDEKRDLLAQIAERREQLDDRDREIRRLNEIVQDLRQQMSQDQEQLARLRSQASVSDVSEHMLKQSLELAKSQVKWLDEELVKTQTEMQQAKSELARAGTTGRAEAARQRAEIDSLNEQMEEQRQRNAQLGRMLKTKAEGERLAKEELAEQTEQFKREMAAQKKLCAEWEKTTEAAKEHVRGVEASLRELESHQQENEQKTQSAVAMMEQRVAEAEQAYNEAQEHAAKLEEELRTANQLLAESASGRPPAQQGQLLLSPTASIASRLQGSQKSLNITQLYSEKIALEDKLKAAETEIDCLRQSMEQILSEIEERGPIIAAEREEYHRLLKDADQIAKDLAEMRQDNTYKDRSLKNSLKERDLLQRQLASEKQQTRDLGRQVTRLLRATEEARMGGRSIPEQPDDSHSASANPLASPMARRAKALSSASQPETSEQEEQWLNEVDRVISQKLVTFSDIVELAAQNRRLLRTTRELAAQVAQEEELQREANEDEVKNALEQAEALLDQLSLEFEDAKKRLGVVERERDMLKTIKASRIDDQSAAAKKPLDQSATQPEIGEFFIEAKSKEKTTDIAQEDSQTLAQLQDDFNTYKSETRKTRLQLERDATNLQAEVSELRVRAAKAEAQNQFDSDRIQMFTRDLEARQKEIEHLRLATSRLHKQVESYEKQLDTTAQEMSSERVELSKLRRQTTLLEAERDNMLQNEQRWRNEEQRLVAERASLTQILENTTKMRDEWQKSSDEQVIQARERLEAARKETDNVRQELKQTREANERAQFKFDAELRELRGQIQQREARISQLQEQIVESKTLHTQLQGEKRELVLTRDSLQEKISSLELRIQNQEELIQRVKGQGQDVSKESLLSVQLQDARSQIESLQSELATTSKRAEDYRQLSVANESSLQELTQTYDQYKAEKERVLSEQIARVGELEIELEKTQSSLSNCKTEMEAVRQTAQTAQSDLATQKSELTARLSQLESEVEQKTRSLNALRDDMQRHEESAQSLQEQYEREIVAHAKDVEGTLLAREKLRETQKRLSAATAELQANKQASTELQNEIKKAHDAAAQEVQVAEDQVSEIKRQNALLLAHLESLGHQVPDVSMDPEQIVSTVSGTGDDSSPSVPSDGSSLRDVVVYLRRERDLVSAQLELAQQETQRWKQSSTHTQRMLDEARNELMQYTPTVGDVDSAGAGSATSSSGKYTDTAVDAILSGEGPINLSASQRQACRQQIEQSMLLRESNSVLRSELNTARGRLHAIEAELTKVKDQEVPQLRSTNASLQAELAAVRKEIQQLQQMCEHWKQRHENILAKYQMIEPEEYDALKKQNEDMQANIERVNIENNRLQEQVNASAQQKVSADTRKAKLFQSEINRLKAQVESLMGELTSARDSLSAQESRNSELRQTLDHSRAEEQKAAKEAQEQKAKFDKLHTTFQKLRQQSMEKLDQTSKTIKSHEATIQSLNDQIQALRERLESTGQPATTVAAPTGDDTVARLQNEVAALTEDKENAAQAHQQLVTDLQQTQKLLEDARLELATQKESNGTEQAVDSTDISAQVDTLKQKLAEAEAKIKEYESQLEQLKARALKYARDNKILQAKATELEKRVAEQQAQPGGSSVDGLQKQLADAQKQLAESEAKIEAAQANAKKSAELRSKLQISRATKRAEDLEKQVNELQAKIGAFEASGPSDDAGSLKRPHDSEDTPAKKPHVEQ